MTRSLKIVGVDVFCGAGGLTYGLQKAGISVVAGIDVDSNCEYPFRQNNRARFIQADVKKITGRRLRDLYPRRSIRLLAGCAPCRPFSSFLRGTHEGMHEEWGLVDEFFRLVRLAKPELVTMENVPDLASKAIFLDFVSNLEDLGYHVDFRSVYCPTFGVPQHRRRLVLIASLIGSVEVPSGHLKRTRFKTVRDAIGRMPALDAGFACPGDRLHMARSVNATNLARLRASRPGGTWKDWPRNLRAPCHRRKTGASYQSVYARMSWDEPSPTITTQAFNFGTGRFGHPEQDRSLTLREAAILQTFPKGYRFVAPNDPVYFKTLGRLIGNAVPPRLAYFIGKELVRAARDYLRTNP